MGFPVAVWEPAGLGTMVGEFSVRAPEGCDVFAEVKSPGWEGELTQPERLAGLTKLAKYEARDGGAFGNWQSVRKCIASPRTYPKFGPTQSNLLVIADDYFVPLQDSEMQVEIALYSNNLGYAGEKGYFTSPAYENLGGIAFVNAECRSATVEHTFRLYENPFSLPQTKLPRSMLALRSSN
jgi:hypothetical protein